VRGPGDITSTNYLERTSRHRLFGVGVAIVTDNADPDKLYRVKIRYPWLDNGGSSGGEQSYWARIATIGAGKDRGIYFLPEVNDEVLVAFEHGDMQHPFIIGALWNKDQTNYEDHSSGANDRRTFKSRSGHFLEFEDGALKVTLKTQGGHILEMDDNSKTITMKTSGGDYLKMVDASKITLMTQGDMLIDVANTLDIKATTINVKSSADTNFTSGANWNCNASSNWIVQAGSNAGIQAGGQGAFIAGATLTLQGSIVNIN
jgi:uncharacterized protein involved in type VI secretion and phage assembly